MKYALMPVTGTFQNLSIGGPRSLARAARVVAGERSGLGTGASGQTPRSRTSSRIPMAGNAWLISIDRSTKHLAATRDRAPHPWHRALAGVAYAVRSLRMASASFSATATTVQWMLARGIVGKTEASATRSPATP